MNKTLNKFKRLAVLADMCREESERLHDEWATELTKTDAMLNLAEVEKSGITLDKAITYRDYLWQVRQLMDQLGAVGSDVVMNADEDFTGL